MDGIRDNVFWMDVQRFSYNLSDERINEMIMDDPHLASYKAQADYSYITIRGPNKVFVVGYKENA